MSVARKHLADFNKDFIGLLVGFTWLINAAGSAPTQQTPMLLCYMHASFAPRRQGILCEITHWGSTMLPLLGSA